MSLAQIKLPTNKTDSIISDHVRKIGQGERGQKLDVIVLDANNSGYDLTDKIVTFSENKEGGKIVSDSSSDRIKITDAQAGRFTYTLAEAVYAVSGIAWFDISSRDGTIIDTTKSFNIEVVQDESIHINNDNYVSSLEALETHYQAIIKKTEENNEALIDQFKKDISQAISDGNNRVDAIVNSFNTLKDNWDSELTRQKLAITDLQNNWKEQSEQLKNDFNKDKNAAIDAANKNFSDKLTSIQSDYDTWKQSTVNDFKTQLDKLETELKTDEDAQKQLQTAIAEAKSAIDKIQDVDFTQFLHKSDLENYYTKTEVDGKLKSAGQTKSVNGVKPDSTGNITIEIPDDYVKSVNGQAPDASGNVTVDIGGVKTINGKKGDVKMATFAPNLITGTSDQSQSIPSNTITDVVHLTTDANAKYTVAVDIDYSAFSAGSAGATLQVNNGGTVVESSRITAGSKGRVSVTFTTPENCLWVTILLNSNSSYTGSYSCLKASRWQDTNTPPDMTWLPSASDNSNAIKDLQNEITKMQTDIDNGSKIWQGTIDDYKKLSVYDDNIFYIIISKSDVVVK